VGSVFECEEWYILYGIGIFASNLENESHPPKTQCRGLERVPITF